MLSAVSSPSVGTLSSMQSLRSLNKQVSVLQSQIATGKRVNTAKDNAAIWSLSNKLSTDLAVSREAAKGLSIASATVATASAASESVVDLLQKMKSSIASYKSNDPGTTPTAAKLTEAQAAVTEMLTQITGIIGAAQFQGSTLFGAAADLTYTANGNGGTLTVSTKDLAAVGTTLGTSTTSATTYDGISTALDTAIGSAKTIATYFGTAASRIETQVSFIGKLNDNLGSAISNLVDTDMDEASARLTALQTQQQLATQLLSITTQNQSTLVQTLFRGF